MTSRPAEHSDVLIVGAGLSGIDAAYNLLTKCPKKSFTILEGRSHLGGTWDLFRYPGIRSDSDMHTLGFGFKPWEDDKSIAEGPAILAYLEETVAENHIERFIRYDHLVSNADWSSTTKTWTVTATEHGEIRRFTCNFLFMCAGYYSYKEGHKPDIAGLDRFGGELVHPQEWPEDLDHSGKEIVVIGSGATAVTLVPALAETAKKVTMLQRSPTWMVSRPDPDPLEATVRKLLPPKLAHSVIRRRNTWQQGWIYEKTRSSPDKVSEHLLNELKGHLDDESLIEQHFTPEYNPWDQRLCLVPNADLFEAINNGSAQVVTDTIDTVTETGVKLESGGELEADMLVTATGLKIVTLGEVEFSFDGDVIDFSKLWTYKGLAYSGVPNLVSTFGYINASWTLRADIICDLVCRILNHMTETETSVVTPTLRPQDANMEPRPWVENFSAGYLSRAMDELPKQGDRPPWLNTQSYKADIDLIVNAPVADDVLVYT